MLYDFEAPGLGLI